MYELFMKVFNGSFFSFFGCFVGRGFGFFILNGLIIDVIGSGMLLWNLIFFIFDFFVLDLLLIICFIFDIFGDFDSIV